MEVPLLLCLLPGIHRLQPSSDNPWRVPTGHTPALGSLLLDNLRSSSMGPGRKQLLSMNSLQLSVGGWRIFSESLVDMASTFLCGVSFHC